MLVKCLLVKPIKILPMDEYFYELNVYLHSMDFDTYGYNESKHVMLIFPSQCGYYTVLMYPSPSCPCRLDEAVSRLAEVPNRKSKISGHTLASTTSGCESELLERYAFCVEAVYVYVWCTYMCDVHRKMCTNHLCQPCRKCQIL